MTDFEKKVLKIVSKIPLGEVRTYKWVAQKLGKPKSYRAVANALAKNPYPLIIPCHRVVPGSYLKDNKSAGGYSLGRKMKKDLIDIEKIVKDVIK